MGFVSFNKLPRAENPRYFVFLSFYERAQHRLGLPDPLRNFEIVFLGIHPLTCAKQGWLNKPAVIADKRL